MREAVAELDPYVIEEDRVARFGDPARIFFNVNSPEDLAAAERMLGHTGRFSLPLSRR
jgi:molybdopterin-guanine dinucleotide biosynthesis protein A